MHEGGEDFAGRLIAGDHADHIYLRVFTDGVFYLSDLNAHTANFDLVVTATDENEIALFVPFGDISGLVKTFIVLHIR
ncbi:hypothetical protein [Haematospirillum sp. H4485]|uniref:hypothetical protein n=1 Tax=Haematospirillum sp. H4485 TaxID=2723109 RepID=UPI001FD7BACA|nr:hypothetical protein [Haematospirillum sp. H4485]